MVFIIVLCVASFLVLLYGHILEPFMNFMDSSDDSVDSEISAPREITLDIIQIIWPKGLLLIIFLGVSSALFLEYQKKTYKEG